MNNVNILDRHLLITNVIYRKEFLTDETRDNAYL